MTEEAKKKLSPEMIMSDVRWFDTMDFIYGYDSVKRYLTILKGIVE